MVYLFFLLFSLNCFSEEKIWSTIQDFPKSFPKLETCKNFGNGECIELLDSTEKYIIANNQIILDLTKKSEYEAKITARDLENQKQLDIQKEILNHYKSIKAIAVVRYYNKKRNLTTQQRNNFRTSMKPIIDLLLEGDSESAKDLIVSINPDGIIITQSIKDEVLLVLE